MITEVKTNGYKIAKVCTSDSAGGRGGVGNEHHPKAGQVQPAERTIEKGK